MKHLRIPIMVGTLALGGSAIVLARYYKRPDPPTEPAAPGMTVGPDSVTLTADAPMWHVIHVAPAEQSGPHWADPVPARITFDEARASRIGSPLAGRVTAVYVERGQRVAKGAPLFAVASPNLAELHADLDKANVERGTAKVNLDRTKALVDAGSLPAKELVTSQQQVAEAELAVKLATQKLASLKVGAASENGFTVSAPRDGVVVEKSVAVGQNVDPSNTSVLAIADLSDVWVVADLFETDVGSLAPGAKAKVLVGTTELEGVVDQVPSVIDPDRHTVPVRVKLPNPDGALRPNAYARIQFYVAMPAKAQLPTSAVMSDGDRTYVFVKEKTGALKRRTVVLGPVNAGKVPVISGLEAGEPVVVQGGILLDNQIELED